MKDTEKLYFLHKVPLLNMCIGQEFSNPSPEQRCQGEGGMDPWALLALLLPGIGMAQATNGLV